MTTEIKYEMLPGGSSQNLGRILTLWNQLGEEAWKEAWQPAVIFTATDSNGEVVGMSVAEKNMVRQLRHELFQLRVFVLPDFRLKGIGAELIRRTFDALEKTNTDPACLGVYCWISDDALKTKKNEAIWPETNMVYLGNASDGRQLRVRYFKRAVI